MSKRNGRVIFGSNLKMYKTNQATVEYLRKLQELTGDISRDEIEMFILPSYTAIADSCRTVDPAMIKIGSQNVHWEPEGRFTGEVSVPMLQEIGTWIVMIGHAERRQVFGETDTMVNQRVLACLERGMRVLVCVGDTAQDKEYGIHEDKIAVQLKTALYSVQPDFLQFLWVAYEPVWAIGEGGVVASPDFANSVQVFMRSILDELYPGKGVNVPILYGGSVNLENGADLISQSDIDGLFIGRAAWDADNFNRITRAALKKINLN